MIESLPVTAARVITFKQQKALINASGFFFALDDADDTLARLDEIARFERACEERRTRVRPRCAFV